MKLLRFIVLVVIVTSCNRKTDKILPEERTLIEAVYASVTIQPDSLYRVHSVVPGILDKNFVEEGVIVKKDQAIIKIIDTAPKINEQNAKLSLRLAKENYDGSAAILNGIKDEIDAAMLQFRNDSINYIRQKRLWENQIGSKIQYDNKKLNYELSSNNLKQLQSKYDKTQNELSTALKQAQNNYLNSLILTEDFTVRSKQNGKVYALYKEPGEIVNIMEPLALIGSASNFLVEMLIDEVDIVKISKEQEVLINLDAYPNKIFKGKISKIYPEKDQRNQTFRVDAIFDDSPKLLYPGLSGEANIIINRKEHVLTIPRIYLIEESSVLTDDGLIKVKTGLQNLEYIEILSGINNKTFIYYPTQ